MSYSRLRGRIRELYNTDLAFAKALKCSPAAISSKLNGKAGWSLSDMRKICELLNIEKSDIYDYFFDDVQKS